jgi:hypothetical protein
VVVLISGAYGPLNIFFYALGVAAFGVEAWAFVDSIVRPKQAYLAAGKLTKTKWLLILGVAVAFGLYSVVDGSGFGSYFGPAGIILLAAFVAAAVYLSDVRPRIREFKSGNRIHSGPYGPW